MQTIEYTNKSALNENADIADVNKCNAVDMNEIKTVVNANASECGDASSLTTTDKDSLVDAINEINANMNTADNKFNNLITYSTTEVNTGKKWINNKPIYRKVITGTTGNSAGDIAISHGISNLEKFIRIEGFTDENDQRFFPNFYSDFNSQYALIVYYANPTSVRVVYGSSRTNKNFYLILEYTKTTS